MNNDKFDNNKDTPTKRTDFKDDTDIDINTNTTQPGNLPEIDAPKPSNATNDIPTEMPNR